MGWESGVGGWHLKIIVDGINAVGFFVMCLKIHWNMVVPPSSMTGTCEFLRISTSHFVELSWDWLASLPMKFGWNSISTQRKRSFVYRDDVSVWELEGLLLVDDTTIGVQILSDVNVERERPRSPRQIVSCSSAAFRRNLLRVRRAGENWRRRRATVALCQEKS